MYFFHLRRIALVGSLLSCSVYTSAQPSGIADFHPGDTGIENHPDVVFVEMFEEASISEMASRWEDRAGLDVMSFSGDLPAYSSGEQSLLMTQVGGQNTGGSLYTRLLPGYDRIHVRYYVKFDPQCYDIHHFSWLGGHNPSTAWPDPRAGIRPVGDERFSSGIEPYGSAWRWDFYTYWMGMRGVSDGYWGNDFINDSNLHVARGEWICIEHMIKMNAPVTESNGEQALWVNGELWSKDGQVISHLGPGFPNGNWIVDSFIPDPAGPPFEGYRWRTVEELNINYFWLYVYISQAPNGYVSKVWFDHVVVATDYIGPITEAGPDPTPTPTAVNGPWLQMR